jgi:hypothetical protein
MILAPKARQLVTFTSGAHLGMTTVTSMPRSFPWYARASAWLPADAATTPLAQPFSPSAASFADAPRTLNEPVRWRFSAFRTTVPPACSEIVRVERTGVRRATPRRCRPR